MLELVLSSDQLSQAQPGAGADETGDGPDGHKSEGYSPDEGGTDVLTLLTGDPHVLEGGK